MTFTITQFQAQTEKCFCCNNITHKYCEDCCRPICDNCLIALKYDLALDADDGYGDYFEVWLCQGCANNDN